jgi:uncharacterized membrane protein
MDLIDVLKLVHILAAIVWVGGAFFTSVVGSRMKNADPPHRLGFARMMQFVSIGVFTPAAVIVLAVGSWMVLDTDLYTFEQAWIGIGIGVVAISAVMGPTFFKPTIDKAVAAMEAGDGPAAGALMQKIGIASRVVIAMQIVAIWAMVAKPGL